LTESLGPKESQHHVESGFMQKQRAGRKIP